ncbi:hypothetical protein [Sporisorium scitamineum]|uniref:60S ribosomal protein L12, mitochondrial n=1 Tax=Sporisorium scitamineum TaxID=49012 RepID=A0A0F7S831_9BASI|nr:hypothetical protein [Sporisorium scitamineum]
MISTFESAVASSSRTLLRSSTRRVAPTAFRSLSTTIAVRNAAPVDAKISGIVDQIEKLTLLEAADLVSHLKTPELTGLKDPTAKAKVIREVKAANSNMNLVEAKKFVESTPQVLKEGLNKDDAEKLKTAIEAAGGTVELE